MIAFKHFSALLLCVPLVAGALELREQPVHSLVVVPSAASANPSDATLPRPSAPSMKLRDSLRQPLTGAEASKPFRLSPEERQRLREQLRGQTSQAEQDR